MSNEKNKQKVSFWLDKSLLAQLDGLCARDNRTRTELVVEALERFFEVYKPSPELEKLEAIEKELKENSRRQEESNRLMIQAIIQAIKEQPIAVQQQLPEVSEKPHKGLRRLFKRKESK
jgi:predicted transcriptional regulator